MGRWNRPSLQPDNTSSDTPSDAVRHNRSTGSCKMLTQRFGVRSNQRLGRGLGYNPGRLNAPNRYRINAPVDCGSRPGLKDRAPKDIQVKRQSFSKEERIMKTDFNKVLSGESPDLVLREGGVVIVKESFF